MEVTPFVPRSERFTTASRTVPDMGLSFRDLVDRHMNGRSVKTFSPVYTGPDKSITDGLERMDKMQRQDFANKLSDFVSDARGKLITRKQAERKAANEAAVIAAYEARRAAANSLERSISETVISDPKPGKSKD